MKKSKGKVSYFNRQHMAMETRYVPWRSPRLAAADPSHSTLLVHWIAAHNRPFSIVDDPKFRELMKTGRLAYDLPSGRTVQRDTTTIFEAAAEDVGTMLKVSILFASSMLTSHN